jgi:hypothetical protein
MSVNLKKLEVKAVDSLGNKWVLVADIEITIMDVEGKVGYPPIPPIRHPVIHQLMTELEKLVNERLDKNQG